MIVLKAPLIKKIRDREARIAVIGLGYVGLPTAVIFSNAGFHVTGIDIDQKVVETVSNGECLTDEPGLKRLINEVRSKGLFEVVSDGEAVLGKSDVIFVHVPTPKKDNGTPDLSYVERVCNQVARYLRKCRLVIVASTLPPNTTKGFVAPLLERGSGLKCGIDFWLAYCPERIAPGKALEEFVENDRLIGGYDAESAELANEIFKTVVKGDMFLADATTVEVAKLAENTFRDVNIAFANELALICEKVGVDVVKVVELANTHPRVKILRSGPGVGGQCLPKDSYLLATTASDSHAHQVIMGSRRVNDFMPSHCVDLVLRALSESGGERKDARVLVLGLGYKADVGDTRNSPSKRIVEKLVDLGLDVTVHDPYTEENFNVKMVNSLEEAVRNADCVVVATPHDVYRELPEIMEKTANKPCVVDLVRLLRREDVERIGSKYCGIGLGNLNVRNYKRLDIFTDRRTSVNSDDRPSVVAAIPAYNEEKTIARTVLLAKRFVNKVLVCDDGSEDFTALVAAELGADVIRHSENLGKGAAFKSLFGRALELGADVVVTLDADGQHDPGEIPHLVKPVLSGDADITVGSRFLGGNNGMPLYRRFGSGVLNGLVNIFGNGKKVSDTQSGFRAYNRTALKEIDIATNGIGVDSEILLRAYDNEVKIKEVPVSCRFKGVRGSTYNPLKHGVNVVASIIKYACMHAKRVRK